MATHSLTFTCHGPLRWIVNATVTMGQAVALFHQGVYEGTGCFITKAYRGLVESVVITSAIVCCEKHHSGIEGSQESHKGYRENYKS